MSVINIQTLVEKHGYKATAKYIGQTTSYRRQALVVVAAALVPDNWNGDKKIAAKAVLEGKRGARFDAYIFTNGFISVIA